MRKEQQKAGISGHRRGQQMGFAGQADRNRDEKDATPAIRDRSKKVNKMFRDVSEQQTGSDAVTPSTNSPSTPGMKTTPHNEEGGERGFKERLARKRAGKS